MDFTIRKYRELIRSFVESGYRIVTVRQYLESSPSGKVLVLRHDVDEQPQNALKMAEAEKELAVCATYYFRTPESGCYDQQGIQAGSHKNQLSLPDAIRAIAKLGHEIGYHYEDMSLCHGDVEKAYTHFETWLEYFRRFYAVETICMHGAPTSKWDGKDLWKRYDYRKLGIIGEPYMDTDFSDVFYLTDTGRCWDGYKVSVRDKIPGKQEEWSKSGLTWHGTRKLIEAVETGKLPSHVMITTHPQRWTNNKSEWYKEFFLQNIKNCVKKIWIKN